MTTINNRQIGQLKLFACRELTEQDIVKYSKATKCYGKFWVTITFLLSGKGLITKHGLTNLLENHPLREYLFSKYPNLKILLNTHVIATNAMGSLQKGITPVDDKQLEAKENAKNPETQRIQKAATEKIHQNPRKTLEIDYSTLNLDLEEEGFHYCEGHPTRCTMRQAIDDVVNMLNEKLTQKESSSSLKQDTLDFSFAHPKIFTYMRMFTALIKDGGEQINWFDRILEALKKAQYIDYEVRYDHNGGSIYIQTHLAS